MYMPPDAIPTTPQPSQSTTVPPEDDEFCTFQEDDCDFTIEGDGDFKFERKSGSEEVSIGEDRNGNAEGMFLYAQSGGGDSGLLTTYVISKEFEGEKHIVECFHFWFYIDGSFDGAKNESLLVVLRFSSVNLNDSLVWSYRKATSGWTEGQVELRSVLVEEKYVSWKINVVATKPGDMKAFVAVDDFAFIVSDICETMPKPGDGTTAAPETTKNPTCPDDEVTCGDGTCIPPSKRCNFMFDCPNDTADEDSCPQFYDFETCHSVEECLWTQMTSDGMRWVLTSGSEIGLTGSSSGPLTDFTNKSSGHFLYIQADFNNSDQGFAQIATSAYQNSAAECYFNFYVYLENGNPTNYPRLVPKLSHIELGYITVLDTITLAFVKPGVWEKIEIGIGRHRDLFKIIFFLSNSGNPFKAAVAVDEVNFFECAPPPAQDTCLDDEIHCALSRGCVFKTKLCDYQDDCGDNSDEHDGCEEYTRTDFEDPDQPFGFLIQGEDGFEPGDFQWQRGNGTTNNKGTGPPFDHTTFGPDGHYLYIPSELGTIGDYAWLRSPIIKPSTRDCRLRFFSHMHGAGVGNLTIYNWTSDGALTPLKQINEAEMMDVNKWVRQDIELPSDLQFQVVIEATVGWPSESDIAIDDVSFTPECQFLDQGSTTTSPTKTSTSKRTTSTKRTTKTTTKYVPPTTQEVTSPPSNPNKHTATIVGVVFGVLILLCLVAAVGFTLYRRNVQIPGLSAIQGFLNPNYNRLDNSGVVSLKELSSREQT